ncbi:MAG TPA: alpha/beta hydrolase [Cyclobacteriaceae bacterium]|jgi:pimeloyl-ACP methyl ester carboxylesterase|nr:alpha/beta hydrolase [Cyclobacteriaceae bacterium]
MKLKTLLFLLIALCETSFSQTLLDSTKLGRNEKVGRFAKIRGFNMYYEIYGKGEPLLFIHGNGGSMRAFQYQLPYFAKHFKVIMADSRAQGKSEDTSDSLSYEMMADDFNGLLDYLKIDSCYVVGWSDGGINALLLAMRHPKKVKKLVSTGANLWPDTTAIDAFLYKMVAHMNDSVSKLAPTPKTKNLQKLFRIVVDEPHIKLSDLKKVQCPSLIIGGDHDVILPHHTLLIAEAIPKSYLWILPKSGHSTLINFKNEFNKVTLDFLKQPFRKIQGRDRFR